MHLIVNNITEQTCFNDKRGCLSLKRLLYSTGIVLLCVIVWIVLNESISFQDIILGGALGIISLYITHKYLHFDIYRSTYHIRFCVLIKYFLLLVFQIYKSGFSTIKKIITGKINPDIVEIDTEIKNDLYICFLANSITLTPGTVTIEKNGRKLRVLWIDCKTKDKKRAGEMIKGAFEKILTED